jgi:hypothetical protein
VDARLAERDRVALLRHLRLDPAIEMLVLEVQNRVRILDRGDQQALRILRSGGQTTLRPAMCANELSGFCEWNGPPEKPPPDGSRTTIGTGVPAR